MSDEKVFSTTEQTRSTMRPPSRGRRHMAVSGHALATHAAMRILDKGGNAVDAGIAGMLCLAVLQPDMVSLAGVAPMIIHHAPSNETRTISGLGWWPNAASTEFFLNNHNGKLPEGILRTVIPATPDAAIQALQLYGTMTFAEVAEDAVDLAENGFPVHAFLENGIAESQDKYRQWPENSAVFLPGGQVPKTGELFFQRDLAATMRTMIVAEKTAALSSEKSREKGLEAARDAFYTGTIGYMITNFHKRNGGLLTTDDMAAFHNDVEEPLSFEFGEYTVLTHHAWCQGPLMPMIMNILQEYDLAAMGHNSAAYIHTLTEAMKLAFADRERFFGDPKFVDVPVKGMLSAEYGALRRKRIQPNQAFTDMPPSDDAFAAEGRTAPASFNPNADPDAPKIDEHALDTSYICTTDKWGSFFSATPSDMSFNTQLIPGTGLAVSSRGSQSWVDPNHPSSIAPGKRPRLTPTGCMILRKGKPWMILGTPGGDTQCQTNLQVLFNVILFGMDPQEAVEAPRFATFNYPGSFYPHTYTKGVLRLETRIPSEVAETLASYGHKVELWPDWAWKAGGACMIIRDEKEMIGGADPRRECCGMAW